MHVPPNCSTVQAINKFLTSQVPSRTNDGVRASLNSERGCGTIGPARLKGDVTMRTQTILTAAPLLVAGALLGWLAIFGGQSATSQAQIPSAAPAAAAAPPRPADEKAIRDASQGLARAFAKGDAKAMAAFWTDEGEYLDEGEEPVRGRAALEKAYANFFAKRKQLKVETKTDAVRFLGKDTAVEEGTFTVQAEGSPPNISRYSALYVRQDGRWLVALLKEWGDEKARTAKLDDVAFLIGSWKSAGPGTDAESTYEWIENKQFICNRYTITHRKDQSKQSGMQMIGVDPALGLIRSWTFDSTGGLGTAIWTFENDRWVMDSHGTLPNGSQTTAVNFLTPHGHDEFTWRSVQRTHGADKLPDLGPITVRRVSK
jgi:uncharacterized protein (TIGR02246 family)